MMKLCIESAIHIEAKNETEGVQWLQSVLDAGCRAMGEKFNTEAFLLLAAHPLDEAEKDNKANLPPDQQSLSSEELKANERARSVKRKRGDSN